MKKILSTSEKESNLINKKVIIENAATFENYIIKNGYAQVISTHKHCFHSGKVDGTHIYNENTKFSKYMEKVEYEKNISNILLIRILDYERVVRNIFEYEFLQFFKNDFIDQNTNIDTKKIEHFF